MPRPPILRIAETFASFQGEGGRQGEPTIFVRLAGCNLACDFCDTKFARRGGRPSSVAEIVARVGRLKRRFPAGWVCLTGGEPFLQDIGPLVAALKKAGLRVQIETNGTIHRSVGADRITLSPKPPRHAFHPAFRREAAEAKLVVTRGLRLARIAAVRKALPAAKPLYLQPESHAPWSRAKAARLAAAAVRAGLPNIRLSVQLHKAVGIK
jgi:7-carboxy-7-deazaguanine synthase